GQEIPDRLFLYKVSLRQSLYVMLAGCHARMHRYPLNPWIQILSLFLRVSDIDFRLLVEPLELGEVASLHESLQQDWAELVELNQDQGRSTHTKSPNGGLFGRESGK